MTISERRIRNNKIRRNRQLKKKINMGIITFLLAIGFSLLFFSFKTKAQSVPQEISYKYYKSVMVHANDSLWNYASLYADEAYYASKEQYVNEVISINMLPDDTIFSGQYIIIPYYSYEFIT